MLHLHVVLAVDRAGLVGADGETHHGVFDVGYLRMAPQMTILCPASLQEQTDMLRWAVNDHNGPVALRYPRGGNRWLTTSCWDATTATVENGRFICHKQGSDVLLISYGVLTENVLKAADYLEKNGISSGVIRLLTVAPLPVDGLIATMGSCKKVMIVEECCTGAGIKEALAWQIRERLPRCQIEGIDLGHRFVTHGDTDILYAHYGLDGLSIAKKTKEVFGFEE